MSVGFQITCGGKDLERKDLGGLGRSDDGRCKGKYEERPAPLWKTEVIDSNSNPRWDPFPLFFDMIPGGLQGRLFVECYDWDADGSMDLIGEFRCNLEQFLNQKIKHYFINPRKKSGSFVLLQATPLSARDAIYSACAGYALTFCCKNLDRKDILTLSSDPFLVIKGKTKDGSAGITKQVATMTLGAHQAQTTGPVESHVSIAKTEHKYATLNPVFNPLHIDVIECGGQSQKFIVEVWDWDKNCCHDFIGVVQISLCDILYASRPSWLILNPSRVGDVTYRNSGTLHCTGVTHVMSPKVYADAYTLTICCKNLDRKDITTGKSDPYLQIKGRPKPEWSYPLHWDPQGEARSRRGKEDSLAQIYRSETHFRELNPNFEKFTLNVADCGGLDTTLEFSVYDFDERGSDDLIGKFETTMRELLLPEADFPVKNKNNLLFSASGVLHLTSVLPAAATFSVAPYAFRIKLRAVNVENKDMGGLQRSDPFLVVSTRPYGTHRYIRIYQTEVRHNTRTAEWGEFILEMASCGGWDSDIFLEVWDYDSFNKNDFIGRAKTTIREMLAFKNLKPELKIFNPRKKGNLTYWDSGVLHIDILEPMNPPANYIVPRTFNPINFVVPHGFDEEMLVTTTITTGPTPLGVHPVTGVPSGHLGVHQTMPSTYGSPHGAYGTTPSPYGVQPSPYGVQPSPQPYHTGQPQPSPYHTGQPQPYGTGQPQPNPYSTGQPQPNPYQTGQPQPYGQPNPNPYSTGYPQQPQPNPYSTGQPQNPYSTGQPQQPYGQPPNPYSTGYPQQPQPNPYSTGQPQPYGTQPYGTQPQPYGYGQQPGY